jgi:hypothetical protein
MSRPKIMGRTVATEAQRKKQELREEEGARVAQRKAHALKRKKKGDLLVDSGPNSRSFSSGCHPPRVWFFSRLNKLST